MELPIYENSAPAGTLQIFPQGLYTVFEARLPAKPPLPKGGCPSAHTGAGGYTLPPAKAQSSPRATARVAPAAPDAPNSAFPLTRLWLADESGAAAPLGLLEPREEGRVLRRRFTRLELRRLPARPVRALALPDGERPPLASPCGGGVAAACGGDGGGGTEPDAPAGSCLPRARGRCPGAHTGADEVSSAVEQQGGEEPRCARGPHQSPPATASPCAGKPDTPSPPPPSSQNAIRKTQNSPPSPWRPLPDGSLVDPERRLLALPWAGGEPPYPARKISLNGRDYLVFRY